MAGFIQKFQKLADPRPGDPRGTAARMVMTMPAPALLWVRRDLHLADTPALLAAGERPLLPVFTPDDGKASGSGQPLVAASQPGSLGSALTVP